MAYGFVRTVDANSGTAQSGLTATIALTAMSAGDLVWLTIKVSSDTRTIASVTDGAGSTWTAVDSDTDLSNVALFLYVCKSLGGAAPTVTVTFDSSAANNVYLWADEYTGLDSTKSVDGNNTGSTASGASVSPSPVTTALQPDIWYVTAESVNGANVRPISTPAGFTQRANLAIGALTSQRCSYDQRLTATGSNSVTVAVTGGNSAIIAIAAAFPESSGGGGLTVDEGEYAPPVPVPLETNILIF